MKLIIVRVTGSNSQASSTGEPDSEACSCRMIGIYSEHQAGRAVRRILPIRIIRETVMNVKDFISSEIIQEMSGTRKILERIPEDMFTWKPHPKSKDMRALATHVATLQRFVPIVLDTDSLDITKFPPSPDIKTRNEILNVFDTLSDTAKSSITRAEEETLSAPWSLKSGTTTIFTMTKAAALGRLFLNHLIHHRAQFTVYLRMNDIPVPGLYGPSADER